MPLTVEKMALRKVQWKSSGVTVVHVHLWKFVGVLLNFDIDISKQTVPLSIVELAKHPK